MSQNRRPKILVTGPDRGGRPAFFFSYLQIWLAGGMPVKSTPSRPGLKHDFQGAVLGGGADVNPALYGGLRDEDSPQKKEGESWRQILFSRVFNFTSSRGHQDTARDAHESEVIAHCLASQMPLLGICRGIQLLNVYRGGSLRYVEEPSSGRLRIRSVFPKVPTLIQADSLLHRIVETSNLKANALHDQEINALGEGVIVSGRSPRGEVRAIELAGFKNVLAVQWHPELMPQISAQRKLFQWLVGSCKKIKALP